MTAPLVLSGTSSLGTPPIAAKARVWVPIQSASDPGPARLDIGEVGGAHDGDENLSRTDLNGEPVNDRWDRVAGVIDKQFVTADASAIPTDIAICPSASCTASGVAIVGDDAASPVYEPQVNRTYTEMAAHYDTAILAARPRQPRNKAA